MRKILVSLAVTALMAASAQAAPSLGWWAEGDLGTTHQRWDFTGNYVNVIVPPGTLEALPEEVTNPTPGDVKMQISGALAIWDGGIAIHGLLPPDPVLILDITIPNYPAPNAYKDIWVDLGLVVGNVMSASVTAGNGSFGYQALQAQGGADFGFRVYPNPQWEIIHIEIQGLPIAMLDYVHIDTICIPAPGAVLLSGIGVGLIGWLRRRRSL